jgi:imidazolonepropionase-like amidohydrolase
VKITEDDAIKWLTIHPAWALGIEDQVGSLEPGKRADVVVWTHDPFSVYARAEKVFIDGHLVRDLSRPAPPWSDFELGQEAR